MNTIIQERPVYQAVSEQTSIQPLGEASVLVEFLVHTDNGKPQVVVSGCYVKGAFVRAGNFDSSTLIFWEQRILEEVMS